MATKAKTKAKKQAAKKAPPSRSAAKGKAPKKVARKAPAKAAAAKAAAPAAPPVWAWHELMTNDVAGARAFYRGLFGWGAQEMPMASGPYTIFDRAGDGHAGCMAIPQESGQPACPPNWMVYMTVEDVDASAAKATALGGKLQVPPQDIPGVGRFAVIADPAGAVFGIYRSTRA